MSELVALGAVAWIDAKLVDPRLSAYASMPHVSGENIVSLTGELRNLKSAAEDGMESGKYLFSAGHVLYSKLRPYLMKASLVDFAGLCSADIYPITTDESRLLPAYARLLLVSPDFTRYAEEASARSRMPKLNREQLFSYECSLPSLDEQRRIARELGARLAVVEEARRAARAQLEEVDPLRVAVFRGYFQEVEGAVALRDVAQIAAGITLGRKTNETELVSVPYLRVANVQDGALDLTTVKTVEATPREIDKWRLRDGDLLLTEGGDLDKLGRGTCWREELPLCIHQNHIFRVRLPVDRYDPDFVSLQVGSPYGKAYFLAHAKKTTGIASINQQVLGSFPLLSPPLAEQRRIARELGERLAVVEEARRAVRAQLDEIEQLPARLLAQAFEP